MVEFKLAPHWRLPVNVVEVWKRGKMIGTIYPGEEGIKVVSKYMAGHAESAAMPVEVDDTPPVPAISIQLIWD